MKQIIFCLLMVSTLTATAVVPDTLELTLNDAVMLAQARSSDSRVARHSFLASEWSYKFYKANYLPSLTLSSSPCDKQDNIARWYKFFCRAEPAEH